MPTPGTSVALPAAARSSVWTLSMPARVQETPRHADHDQHQARVHSLSGASPFVPADGMQGGLAGVAGARFVTVEPAGRWHVIDVPMPGEIRAAVSVSQPVKEIRAFGWTKT
jgi:hypothetical protein